MKRIGTMLLSIVAGSVLLAPTLAQDQTERGNRRERGVQRGQDGERGGNRRRGRGGDANRPARKPAPQLADIAPSFKLKSIDGKDETDTASYRGKKPILLFFGSYT